VGCHAARPSARPTAVQARDVREDPVAVGSAGPCGFEPPGQNARLGRPRGAGDERSAVPAHVIRQPRVAMRSGPRGTRGGACCRLRSTSAPAAIGLAQPESVRLLSSLVPDLVFSWMEAPLQALFVIRDLLWTAYSISAFTRVHLWRTGCTIRLYELH